jgi:hypothetical protein
MVQLPLIAEHVVDAINELISYMNENGMVWPGATLVYISREGGADINVSKNDNVVGTIKINGTKELHLLNADVFAKYLTNRMCQMLADDVDPPGDQEDPPLSITELQTLVQTQYDALSAKPYKGGASQRGGARRRRRRSAG